MRHVYPAAAVGIEDSASGRGGVHFILGDLIRIDQAVRAHHGPLDGFVIMTDAGAQIVLCLRNPLINR